MLLSLDCCKIVACFCHWIVARFVAQILYVFLAHWIDAKFLLCFVIGLLKDCCMLLSLDCSKNMLQDCVVSYVCFH